MKFLSIFLFVPLLLFASVNEPMRWEWQTGYRNDNLHWHLQNPGDASELTYSEHFRNLQFWENALSIRVIYRDIAVFARGAGAFGNGPLYQRFSDLPFTWQQPRLVFHTDAWTVDGWGYFGYSVNLTSDRTYKVILIPFVGASINYEHLDRPGSHTAEGSAVGAETFSMNVSLPGAEKMTWYGPLIGAVFLIQPGGYFQMEAGYAYRRLHLRFKTKTETETALSTSGAVVTQSSKLEAFKVKDGGNLAQTGWAKIEFLLSRQWRLGLFSQVQYFTSKVLGTTVKNKTANTEASQKYKVRWTAVSGELTVSRCF